jgi:mannose-6-phosphate isomerase class I
MPLYEDKYNAENNIKISNEAKSSIVFGSENVISGIVDATNKINSDIKKVSLDGWYGVDFKSIAEAIKNEFTKQGIDVEMISTNTLFKSLDEIKEYKQKYITDDPGFGYVNTDGCIQDIMDVEKISYMQRKLKNKQTDHKVIILYGYGAAIKELADEFDLKYYFDKTRQPLLWEMWDAKLIPFSFESADKEYGWKEFYYCDYYLLRRQKNFIIENMDYYIEAISFEDLKLVPRKAYDEIITTMVKYPIKEVQIYQPGPWGAYRYKDLWDVPGLECNAWNELVGPELSILIDCGAEKMLNMPFENLMQYPERLVGKYLNEHYPGLFPMDVWLDDGYFPKPEPAERTSMPIHNHPSTDYVKSHFNEPLGRYETYYIAEAYEGANTWMGYKDNADLEEWERKCRESNNLKEIKDWKDYIANWNSNVGDLYLIPPGTAHAHGGNQMVLEMDTCPSIAGTEYSFFEYDFARNSWDDNKKTMTGKPLKMHLEHCFDNNMWRRESWVKDNLLAKPKVIKWNKEYSMDRYSTLSEMPFEIERLHYYKRAENDTQDKYMHILTLTVGTKATIRSKKNPELKTDIELFQSAIVPASFGEYEIINSGEGFSTVVLLRWKKG